MSGLARKVLRLQQQANADFRALHRAEAQHHGQRRLVSAEAMSMRAALSNPALCKPTAEALIAAFGATQGIGDGLLAECGLCGSPWCNGREPVAVINITFNRPDGQMLALMCRSCAGLGQPEGDRRLGEMIKKTFFDDGPIEQLSITPGGRG